MSGSEHAVDLMPRRGGVRPALLPALAILIVLALAAVPAMARADQAPPLLWHACDAGSEAGQCGFPRGIAVDPNLPGHIYVADQKNNRVNEFTVWGQFVKAWGWGVRTGAAELQTCGPEATVPSGCQAGLAGGEPGQLSLPWGIAVDGAGDVYVAESGNKRVQKFDPTAGPGGDEAAFLLTFGGKVNKTKVEAAAPEDQQNLCPVDPGDACQTGTAGTLGKGQFGTWNAGGNFIALGGATLYVGDVGRIAKFDLEGHWTGDITGVALTGKTVQALALDPKTGDLYVTRRETARKSEADVAKINLAGATVCTIPLNRSATAPGPTAVAGDSAGNLYVFNGTTNTDGEILKFDQDCNPVPYEPDGPGFGAGTFGSQVNGLAIGSPCLAAGNDVYVARSASNSGFVNAYGPPPTDTAACPAPPRAPEIGAQYAVSVGNTGATVRAQINPKFWAGTSFYVEYGTSDCAVATCARTAGFPATQLNAGTIDEFAASPGVFLGGLQPQTRYYFRFVAISGGGGPVQGEGGVVGAPGASGSFVTSAPNLPAKASCPNQAYRFGFAATLPDCRAYELVSPVDKNGGDIETLYNLSNLPAGYDQSASDGDSVTYSAATAFGDAVSSPFTSQYVARRGGTGWSSHSISPPQEGGFFGESNGLGKDRQYEAFTEDLCSGWLIPSNEPTLSPGAAAGFPSVYRHRNCGVEGYEQSMPSGPDTPYHPNPYGLPEVQGLSSSGDKVVLRTGIRQVNASVVPAPGTNFQLYEKVAGGGVYLVSVLPDGTANTSNASAGTASGTFNRGRSHSVEGAVSAYGDRVYWTASPAGKGIGTIYLRENATRQQSVVGGSGCEEAGKACTYPVSGSVPAGNLATFRGASANGDVALFSTALRRLYLYDATTKGPAQQVIGQLSGVLGMSRDGSRIYLVSKEGRDGATAGENNLYLYENGDFTFIAALSADDARESPTSAFKKPALSPVSLEPYTRSSRVTGDGAYAVFTSNSRALSEAVAGYDNTDANSGQLDTEVYRYDAEADALRCLSCNPTGVRPSGANLSEGITVYWVAAQIPGWESQIYPSRVLSDDGDRVFFESLEALVGGDTNGVMDVYEWEAAGSAAGCEALGAQRYVASASGCLSLISSGTSPTASEFVDADRNGDNVFFKTGQSLVPQDPGQIDVYDARVDGGFPAPAAPPAGCRGQACQASSSAPALASPASAQAGAGNVAREPHQAKKRRCPKGRRKVTRRGKVRCVARHRHRRHHRKHAHAGKRKRPGHRQGRAAR